MANNPAYDPIIAEASRRYNVPEQTIRSVMGVESGGQRDAVSSKGASGLMQVMPETYAELARKHGLGPDRFEPRNNIMAGTAYLRENNDRFGGDWTKTLQAYNAGPGAVESGRPLPAETQAYVPKVQAGMGGGLTREAIINELRRRGKLPAEFDTPSPAPKLTREAVINELRRRGKLPPEFDTPAPAPAPAGDSSSVSAWGELGRGFLKGVDTVQGAGGFVLETLGDKTGFQGLEDYGQGIRERNKTEADQYKLRVNRIEDVHSVGDFADYAAGVLGSFGPQVGVSVAGAGLAALAAPAVGIGAGLAAGVGAAATSFPMNAGEVFQNLLDKGIDRDTAMNIGLAAGIPMAALDAIVPGKVGSRVAGAVAADAGSTLLGRTVKGGIKGSGQEGLTETMQEGTSILAEDYAGVAPTFQEAKSRLLNAGVAGAIAGGPMGAVGGSLERVTPAPAVVAPPATAAPPAPPGAAPVHPPGAPPVAPVAPPPVPVAAPATLPGYQPFFDQDGTTQLGWQSPDGSTVVAMGQSTAPLPTAPDLRTELDQVVNSAKPVAEIVAGNDLHGLLPGEIEMPAYDPMTGEEAPGFYHEASDTWRAAGEAPNFELSSVAAEVQTPSNTVQTPPTTAPIPATTAPISPQPLEPAIQPLSPPVDEAPSPQIRTNPYEVEGREHIVRPGPQRPPPPPRPAIPGEPFVNPPPSADPTVSPKSLYDELRQRGEVRGAGIEDISKPPREGSVGDTWQAKRDADLEALGGEPKAPPVRAELPEGARRGYDYLYGDVRTALALPHGKERNEAVSAARARLTRYVNDALAASFDPETPANKERARRLRAIAARYEAIGKTDQAKKYRDMAAAPPKVDGSGETAVNYLDQWEHIVEIDEKAARGDFTVTQPPKRGPVAPPEPVANIDTEVIVRDEESRLAENIAEGFKHVPADIRKAATDRLNDLARLRAERGYDGKDEPQRHMKPHAIDQIDQRRDNLLAAYNRYVRFLGAQKLGRKQAKYKDGKTEPLYTPETVARELASLQTLLDAPLPTDADLAMDFSGYDVFQLDRHANTYGDASEDGAAALAELRKRPGWGNRRPLELVKERQDIIAKLREEKSPERYAELEAQASSIEEDLARDPAWESYFKYNHNRVTGRHENLTPRQTAEFVRGLADKEKQRGEGLKTKKAKERSAASAAESEAAAERLKARIPQTAKRPFAQTVSMAEKALRERTVKPNTAAIARHLEITEEEAARVLAAVAGRSGSIIRQVQASKKERAAQGRGEGTVTAPRYRFTPRLNGPQTLIDLIASHGGLAPNGDLSAMDLDKVRTPGAGGMLVRKGGMSLDEARELAETEGFIGQETDDYQTTTVNELLEALDNEHRGSKVSTQDKGARHGPQRDQMEAAARALGVSVQDDWSDVELLTEIQESEAIRGDLEAEADIDRAIITSMLEDMGIFDLSLFTPVEEQDFDIPFPDVADGRNGRIEEAAGAVAPPVGDVAEVPRPDPAGEAGAVRQGDRTPEGGTGEAGQAPGAGSQKPTARVEKTDQGDQYVFGGEAGQRTTMPTLKAKFPQEPANEGLFADPTKTAAPEPEQLDIETALAPKPAESRLEALKKRVQLFASGMTRPVDIKAGSFSWGGLKTRGIGIEIGELSREGMQAVINAVVDRKAGLFVDSGAFNLFMAKMRGMAGYDDLLKELGPAAPKPLNFDQILRRYDALLEMIHEANQVEEDLPKPLLVMPDIVGDQAGSIELVEKKAKYIGVDAEMNVVQPIVPIQKGALSLSEAYDKIVKILGTDQFIVGIPGGQKAVTLDELREFLTKSKPPKIHILGNISPKTLDPKLEVIAGIEGYDPIHVSADGNLLRSKLYGLESTAGGKARADAVSSVLRDRAGPEFDEAVNGPSNVTKLPPKYPLDPEQHPTGERVSDILKPGDWFIAPGGYGPYRVEDVRLASDGKEYISTNSLTDIRRTAETKKHLTPGNETVARVEGGRLWAFNEPDVPYLKVSESTANAIQDIAEESGAGIAQSEMKRMLAKPQKAPETTPKINEIKASDLAGLDEASIDALLDEAFGGEPAQKEPEIRDVDGIVVVKTADGWARGRYRDVEGEAPGWVAAPELGKGSTPEFAAKVPPELKPVEYYGRDGKLTTAFVRFAVGDRVRLKENGARGVVTHTGPGPNRQHDGYEEIPRVEVKFDNGVEQILTVGQFEAEPVSESPKSAQNPPENKSAARALFDKHFHFLTGLDELFPIVEAFVTGQQDFAATRAALKATIQKSDTWRESNGEKKASQLRADANLRALHTDMKERGLSTTKQAPKAGASTEGTPPPAQRKVAEMLKPGDVVTAGGSTRYVVKEVRHSQDGGKWKTTVIAYREDTQVEGFEHKLTGAHVEKGLILHDNPGIIKKAEGRAAVAKPRIEPEARPMPSELGSKLASEQSAADILKAAGAAGVKGADEALTGLYKLFGGNKLSSGFTFDEDTYRQAKPHFQEAYKQFAAAGRSLLDFARFIQSNFGDSARPYLKRFLTEGAAVKEEKGDFGDAPNPLSPAPKSDIKSDSEPAGTPPVEPAPELPPGIETPTGDAVDATSVLASHGLKATKVTTRNGKPAWEISGNTHPVRDVLKGMKASWYGPKKVWTFWNDKDPSEEIASQLQSIPPQGVAAKGAAGAAADAGGGAGRDAGDNTRARRKSSSDARLKHVRQREDARADERGDARDAGAWVDPETQALIRRGLKFGMPEEVVSDQIEDVALIHHAYAKGKKLFLLANEAGTGKTFVLGGAIRELRSAGAKSFIYITMNTDLIAQIQRDLAAYGVDDVQFFTYSDLSKKAPELPEGAVLIFDETQNIKDPSSARGKAGQQMIAQAKFTLFASATPFENPVQAKYLAPTGVFDPVGGHTDFAKMYGASVRKMEVYNRRTGKNETVEVPYWLGGKTEDGIAARTWFMKQGIMTQRPKKLPPGMVDGVFRQSDVPQEWLDKYNDVEAAYRAALNQYKTPDGKPTNSKMYSQIAMHRINMIKRILEASKVDRAIERAKHHLKDGKQVVIFVETKAEREVGKFRKTGDSSGPLYSYPEMALLMQRWEIQKAAAKGRSEDPPPFSDAILAISLAMHNLGVSFTLPSTSDEIVRALGKDNVAIYTGAVSGGIASKGKADFLAKRKSVLIATMAKGGTGLSLHDTTGDSPRVQIGLNLPWVASAVDQVSGRIARYGLQSKALIEWLFAGNIPFERSLAQRVGGRMRDMGALVKGIDLQAAGILTEFDLEEETLLPEEGAAAAVEVEQEGKEKEPSLPELLAMAEKLERTRKKLDDTSGGAFFTPYPLAAAMRFIGGVFAGDRVLEPSAGHGALVRFLPAHVTVDMIEQRRDNAEELARLFGKKEGHLVTQGDFLELAAELEGDYDTILMNPPFERAAGVGPLDIAHVRKAYELLAEGGRLVAIMGEGSFFREQSHDTAFRDWLEERGATVVRLPENVFKNSGTGVRARMVVIDEGATPGRSDIDLHDVETDSLEHLVRRIPVRERDRHGVRDRFKAPDNADTPNPPYRVGKMPDLGRVTFDKDGKWQRLGEHSIAWDTATDTPEFRARKDRIVKGIAELVERIGGGRMEAKVFDRIFRMGEADWSESWGVNIRSGPLAGLVALSMSSPDKAGVVRHEAIHFLRDTGLLDGADWRVLEAHAAAWRKMFDIDARYEGWYAEGDQDAILNEEAIADAYAAWANGYLDVKGPVARAFAKLKRFFEAVRNLLAGNGFTTADSVFRRIETGELARADRRTETETAEDYEGDVPGADGEGARYMLPPRRQGNLGQPYGGQGPAPVPPAAAPGRPVNQGNLFSVRTHLPDKSMVEWLMDANYSLIQRVQGATSRAAIGVSVDRFRQLTQDRYIRLRRVQEAVTSGTGRAVSQAENAYLAEELYTSKAGEKLFLMGRDHKQPILEAIHRAGLTIEQVDKYLYARHAKERNARISRINPRFPAGEGSGMTDADAQGIINAFTVLGILPQLDHIANLVDRMTNATLSERVNGGLMSAQEALKWQQTYRHYVPLRGLEQLDDTAMRPAGGQGYNVRGPESQRALGRKSRAESILGNVFMMADEAIIRSEKNQVVISLMNLVNNNVDPTYWQVDKVTIKPVFNKATGLVEYRATTKLSKEEEDRTVRCKVNGVEHRITIHDARLMTALKNLEATKVNMLIAGMMKFNRYLSTVNTGLNPEFLITNLFRDLQAGFINMNAADIAGLKKAVLRDYGKALKGAWGGVRGNGNTQWERYFREFAAAGGRVSFYQLDDLDQHKTKIDLELRRKARGPWHVKRKFKEVFDYIQDANAAVDNGIRLAVFVNARRLGKTDAEAASLAKNLTINFNRRGELGPVMNSAYLFFNAGVQGTAVLLKALKHKKVQKIAAGIVVAGFLMEFYNAMMSPPDDDGEDMYSKIPDFTKSRNFIIMSPDGTALTFPMPYGYNVFADLGRNLAALVRGHQSVARTMGNILKTSVDAFNPIGGTQSLLNFVSPTVLDPIVDLERNEDFAGRKIMPETPNERSKPDSQQYWSNTGPIYRTIAEQLNDLTGGNEWKKGGVDISPESLDYLMNWLAGGAGAFLLRSGGLVTKFLDGTEITMNDVPFARKVIARKGPGADRSLFYERAEAIEALVAEWKGLGKAGRTEEADALKGDLLKMATMAENIRTNLAALRKRRDGVKADGSLTSEERQKRLDELTKREKDQIDHFNRRYVEKVLRPEQEGRALINVR